jgi:hypothetical protein
MSLEIDNAVFNAEYSRAAVLAAILGAVSIAVFVVLQRAGRKVLAQDLRLSSAVQRNGSTSSTCDRSPMDLAENRTLARNPNLAICLYI